MSRREDSVLLRHMLDHAVEAIEVTRNRSRVDLDSDRLFNLALVRLIEIVGEAASRVSPELQAAHPDIHGRRLSVCDTGSSTATIASTSTSFGRWLPKT